MQVFPHDLLPPNYPDPQDASRLLGRSEVERRRDYMARLHQQLDQGHPLVRLIGQCLHNDPAHRPSAEEVLQCLEQLEIEDPYQDLTKIEMIRRIEEREEEVSQNREEIREKEEEIRRNREEIREKEEEIGQNREEIRQNREEIREKEEEISQNREEIRQNREEIREKEVEIRARDEVIRNKDVEIGQKEMAVRQKDEQIQNIQSRATVIQVNVLETNDKNCMLAQY